MDDYADKTYQGSGFTGKRMSAPQEMPFASYQAQSPPELAEPDAPVTQSAWLTATDGAADMFGTMLGGLVVGFVFGIFGIILVAILSSSEKRGERLLGSVAGVIFSSVAFAILFSSMGVVAPVP